jgi:hypothetical protein
MDEAGTAVADFNTKLLARTVRASTTHVLPGALPSQASQSELHTIVIIIAEYGRTMIYHL